MITPSLPARLWFSTQAAISLSLFSLAAQSLRVQAALVSGGPPVCAQTYVSDGVSDYNTIANIFFPEAVVADPSFEDVVAGSGTSSEDEAFNYMYAEIQRANSYANVTLVENRNLCSRCVATPAAGQGLLIPPCRWAEGCQAIYAIPNATSYEDATLPLYRKYNTEEVWLPGSIGSGADVGPPMEVYVGPCTSHSVDGGA